MSMQGKTIYNALPKLPGYNFSELEDPVTYGKAQLCQIDADGLRSVRRGGAAASQGAQPIDEGCGIPVATLLRYFPQWRTLDDKVLRFFAYYIESVDESTIEEERVRKVKMNYYLGNGTLTITETPAVVNSGLRKGTTVSRHKPENVDVFSLCIGSSIHCRGIDYELVDCDAATREFYAVIGVPQPEPLEYPFDVFEASKAPRPMGVKDEQHVEMKRAVEVQAALLAGTHASLLTTEERAAARNFYRHDGEVLRFNAVWSRREFRIQYYLADGTISIMFDGAPNDGRDAYRVFARRAKIPKDKRALLLQTETLNRPIGAQPEYVTWQDLRPGATVDLNARTFEIYDCDAYTRKFLEEHGVAAPSCARPATERDDYEASKLRAKGGLKTSGGAATQKRFGASSMVFDDSNQAKDPVKFTRFSKDVFRFVGRIVGATPIDAARRFLVCYYLADDTVSVYELVARNSGHIGGKIFARRRVDGIDSPHKLCVGEAVELEGVRYQLEAMDDRTRAAIDAGMPEGMDDEYFRLDSLVSRAREAALARFNRTQDMFRHYASSATAGLNADNVQEMFTDAGLHLNQDDLAAVMARLDSDKDGWVSLADLTDRFLGQQFSSTFQPHNTMAAVLANGGDPSAVMVPSGPIRSAQAIAEKADAERSAEEVFRKFLSLTEARRTLITRTFRNVASATYDGGIGVDDFVDCVTRRLHVPLSDDEVGALVYKFFYTKGMMNWMARRLPYNEVHRLVQL